MTVVGYGPMARIDGPPPVPPQYGLVPAAASPAAGIRLVVDVDQGGVIDLAVQDRMNGTSMDETLAALRDAGSIPREAGQERWLNGVEVYPYSPDRGDLHDACATGTDRQKSVPDAVENPLFNPITVYTTLVCNGRRLGPYAEWRSRAITALTAIESSLVGRHFLSGEGYSANPHLADGNATILNGGVVTDPSNGIALLEQAIGETGAQGVIHLSPQLAVSANFGNLAVDNRSGVLRTINGTPVIPDFGYAVAHAPTGGSAATGTQEWIYATGPIDLRRSEVIVLPDDISEALDRETNIVTIRAERFYLIDWDTQLQAAVLVDRCRVGC